MLKNFLPFDDCKTAAGNLVKDEDFWACELYIKI